MVPIYKFKQAVGPERVTESKSRVKRGPLRPSSNSALTSVVSVCDESRIKNRIEKSQRIEEAAG